MKILYGTGNPAKLQHMQDMLIGLDLEIIGLCEVDVHIDVLEEGNNPLENARLKAQAYYKAIKMPVFSCDSGLYIEGLPNDEQPGVHVRRVEGQVLSDAEMIEYYTHLASRFGGEVKARYHNAICLILDEQTSYEYAGDDIASESFLITAIPHAKRVQGFPLDSISKDIKTGKYYFDLGDQENDSEDDLVNGFREFFLRTVFAKENFTVKSYTEEGCD